MSIKIAIIDIGIFDELDKSISIKHFYQNKGQIVEGYKEPLDAHGSLCLKEILKQDIKFDILDINIADGNGKPQLDGVVLGIKKAIEKRADIINISLGLKSYSEELYSVCQDAIENNIAIISAASHSGNVSYPANFKNVLCVEVNGNPKTKILKIDDSTLSVYMEDNIISYKNTTTSLRCTSMASAYFSGVFGKNLESTHLYDKFAILRKLYNISLDNSHFSIQEITYNPCKVYDKIRGKRVAVVLIPYVNIDHISKNLKLKNIVAFYDYDLKDFCSFNDRNCVQHDFDLILIINTEKNKVKISDEIKNLYKNKEIIFLGEFENETNSSLIYDHENFASENIATLAKPTILIAGLGSGLNKFDVQKNLAENFNKDCVKVISSTYNPSGSIYGFDIFKFPSKITFPDIVCSINHYICCIEKNVNPEIFVMNVAGGCFFMSNQNVNIFGKLIAAYLDACNVDIFILCLNNYLEIDTLNSYISQLKNIGIKEVLLVLSENAFNAESFQKKDGLQVHKMDNKIYEGSLNFLTKYTNEKVFTLDDVRNNNLYNYIVTALTSEE